MPLSNVLSGAAFKSALWSLLAFLLALLVGGFSVHRLVESAMYDELAAQMTEELLLFQQIEGDGGTRALVTAIEQLNSPVATPYRLIGLFDQTGQALAGSRQIAPDFIGWKSVTVNALFPETSAEFYSNVLPMKGSMLVIGRSTQFITSTLSSLVRYLVLAGVVVFILSVGLGLALSHRVHSKLTAMTQALDAVSHGDMSARLSVSSSNDQIDRASVQINNHLEQLSSLMASTRNTIQAIAHDVRTPLNRAFLLIQDSLQSSQLDDAQETLLEEAAHELEEVTSIFDTVLRISKISASHDKQNFTIFPADLFLQEMADLFEPIAESSGQTLSCRMDPTMKAFIRGDRRMLRQMMVNLIENAICHCPQGALITLNAHLTNEHQTCIVVSDNGLGIPADKLSEALKPFYRLDASRSTPGSGLGLSLVDAIVTRHQAHLVLESNNPGLRVSVIFPQIANTTQGTPVVA